MWQAVRTFFLVLFLTALVWTYAASKQITQESRQVAVELIRPGPELDVEINGPRSFDIRFSGPQKLVAEAVYQLERADNVIRMPVPSRVVMTAHEEPVAPLLEQAAVMRGLRVETADPPTIRYTVDRIVKKTIKVKVLPPEGFEFDGDPVINPPEVTVAVPQGKWNDLQNRQEELVIVGKMVAPAATGSGQPVVQTVNLEPKLDRLPVDLAENKSVEVTCTFEAPTEKTLGKIPIEVRMNPEVTRNYEARISKKSTGTATVKVTAPTAALGRIKLDDVCALVRITSDDKPGEELTKRVEVWVSPGLPATKVELDTREVLVSLKERTSSAAK